MDKCRLKLKKMKLQSNWGRALFLYLLVLPIAALILSAPGVLAQDGPPKGAKEKVIVGAYINDIQQIDIKSHNYSMDVYVWFRWHDPKMDPSETIEFMNPVDLPWLSKLKTFPKPRVLKSGELYQVIRAQGKFSRKLPMDAFPFEHHAFLVALEDSISDLNDVEYIADTVPIAMAPDVTLPGYILGTPTLTIAPRSYSTQFGDVDKAARSAAASFSRILIEVPASRPHFPYGIKFILPILGVVFCAGLMFFLKPQHIESRINIGITALLTIVALQITLNEDLPEIDYLVLIDKLYIAAYVFVIASLAIVVRSTRVFEMGQQDRARRVDRNSFVVILVIYLASVAYLLAQNLS